VNLSTPGGTNLGGGAVRIGGSPDGILDNEKENHPKACLCSLLKKIQPKIISSKS